MPIERVSQGFKDISMTFQSNPLNNDLIAIKNENSIASSFLNIVFTTPGEMFFNQSFGSRISESINRYEPRVKLSSVKAYPDFDNNGFDVIVTYDVIGAEIPRQELQFVLQSSR